MARVHNNWITLGLSGRLGEALIFRTVNGQTYLSQKPTFSGNWSAAQQANRHKLQRAMTFARDVKQRPELLAPYEQAARAAGGYTNATSLLVRDFFHAPQVTDLTLHERLGTTGQELRILATDDFRV